MPCRMGFKKRSSQERLKKLKKQIHDPEYLQNAIYCLADYMTKQIMENSGKELVHHNHLVFSKLMANINQ